MAAPWFATLPAVTGSQPVSAATLESWPDRAMDERLSHLAFCPVQLAELYQIAWHYPLTVRDTPEGPMLMADLRPDRQSRAVFDAGGQLQRSHRPMVSRLLPFTALADGRPVRLVDEAGETGPVRAQGLRQQLVQLLALQGDSHRQVAAALRLLQARGALLPDPEDPGSWIPAALAVDGATGTDAAALFLGLRILALIDFADMHRRARPAAVQPPSGRLLEGFLSRDEVLRQRQFLDTTPELDFSGLGPPAKPC